MPSALRRPELTILALPGLIGLGILAFLGLAALVRGGVTETLDRALLLAMRSPADISDPLGPQWFEEMVRDVTAFGGTGPLVFIGLAGVIYLLLRQRQRTALFLFLAIGGGQMLSSLLKLGFDRPRPDLVPHGMEVYTASFPSGHATMTAVTYLTLAALLARAESRRRIKIFLLLLAVLITLLVGISRLHLGVHWPSDVLGGWIIGSAWAAFCWLLAAWLQRHGEIEREAGNN